MAGIQVAANFSYKGKKPLDDRLLYDTVAEMVAMPDSSLYDGMKVYVKATDKYYKYKSTNEVDVNLGKWREDSTDGDIASRVDDIEAVIPNNATAANPLVTDNDISGFIDNTVDNLVNYYKKTETYSQTEIDTIVANIKNSRFEVVQTLPTEDIETNVIYLVPRTVPETDNIKDEYINIDGTSDGWEKIGSTNIDLSNYVTTSALNTALADYTTTADLTALLAAKQDTIQFSTMPTASADNLGKVYQYVGSTNSTYTKGHFYECVSDEGTEPTYSWEDASPSGSGSSEIEENVVANTTVGAISSGTTIAQGTDLTDFVKKLLISEIAPTVTFSTTKDGNVKYGESYNETLTINVTNMGTAKSIDSISWYKDNTLIQTDTISSSTIGSWTHVMSTAVTDSVTFKAVVNYTKSDDTSDNITKTANITFWYDKFYGAVDSLTPTEANIEALTSALGTAKGGTYNFTTSAARIAYAYPKSLGALTSIKDGNGFSLFDSFTRTEQTYTQNGTSVTYYLYVLTDPTTVTNYSVTFA